MLLFLFILACYVNVNAVKEWKMRFENDVKAEALRTFGVSSMCVCVPFTQFLWLFVVDRTFVFRFLLSCLCTQ